MEVAWSSRSTRQSCDNLRLVRQALYSDEHAASPFNQLFAALYDLIFSRTTKAGLLVHCQGRTVRDIFAEKIDITEGCVEKWLTLLKAVGRNVSAELMAYLQ